jgi:superoxide dismutase, Fe-Mn family
MTTALAPTYTAKKWDLSGLKGISDHTLEVHFGLYEGYVKNTNLLNEQIGECVRSGQGQATDPRFAEFTRRLSFEYNGMVLHEQYFDNLTSRETAAPATGSLHDAVAESFGDFDTWKKNFAAVGGLRGVGWAIAYQDPNTGGISNQWVSLHQNGNIAGFRPLLVMDVWEHAFMLDYKPAERSKYIEAFLQHVDWAMVESRLIRP